MKEEEPKLRTMFITYQADDDDSADTFMIVVGTVIDNMRGIKIVEYQDDTVFADGGDAMTMLHELATSSSRLTPAQQAELDEFSARLGAWDGESP